MSKILPILFNTEMVQATLAGRKTCTRRVIKDTVKGKIYKPPFQPGDILYVRETWCDDRQFTHASTAGRYFYKASENGKFKWKPSIHMPKEIARIWLKVTDVRVERLQRITETQAQAEGCNSGLLTGPCSARWQFENLWNSAIKKSDIDKYGWAANPLVWVIEFERCEDPVKE